MPDCNSCPARRQTGEVRRQSQRKERAEERVVERKLSREGGSWESQGFPTLFIFYFIFFIPLTSLLSKSLLIYDSGEVGMER